MKSKYIIVPLFLLIFSGCVTIVKWKYGITNPREQTPEKLHAFLKKHKYPDTCQFVFTDSSAYFHRMRDSVFKKHLFSNMIFDRQGSLLQSDPSKCQWSGFEVVKSLNKDSAYPKSPGPSLAGLLDQIEPFGPEISQVSFVKDPDFTVIVTWALFLGTYNARLFELSEAVAQNPGARIRLVWINMDMQERWNLTKNQKLEIR